MTVGWLVGWLGFYDTFSTISTIDLVSAFFQVKVETNSQKYTGFQTPFGTFSYLRMPQELKAAPSTCQRLMDFVLGWTDKYAGTLTDDTMVFSKTFEEHLVHVRDILQRLRMAGLTANSKKCSNVSNSMGQYDFMTVTITFWLKGW